NTGKDKIVFNKEILPDLKDRKKYHEEFASSTSLHGVHNIVHMQSKARRAPWLLIFAGCLAIVVWQIYSHLIYYFSWPTTTTVVVQHMEKVKFPTVTFCSLNRFQAHAMSNLKVIFLIWNTVSAIFQKFAMEDKYSQELNDFLLGNKNFSIKDFTRKNGFYVNSSTLLECDFFGKPCYPQDYEHAFTEYGNCFIFNHNDLSARRVSLSGRGLHLLFDVQQDKFTDKPTLGYTDAGKTFVIHSPQELPRFGDARTGLNWPAEALTMNQTFWNASCSTLKCEKAISTFLSFVTITLQSIIQEYPWGECKPDIKLQYHKNYSTNGCLLECKARYIQDWCGCLPFILPGNGTECDLLKFYKCVYPAVYYPTTVTYSNFGGEKAIKYFSTKLKKSSEYIRQNLVHIEIKYHDLSYKITQQQKALTISELLANVGGQLGLFCGASMITIIELLEYIFTNFCWMCIFLLLKAPEMPQWNNPCQNQP
ncbi:hypothetical protein DV515_00002668, partial [Chloebia gouldiae]